jgi:hypothetical protein
METFATRHSYKVGRRTSSPRKKSPPPYHPATVYADEYADSPTEEAMERSSASPTTKDQERLSKLLDKLRSHDSLIRYKREDETDADYEKMIQRFNATTEDLKKSIYDLLEKINTKYSPRQATKIKRRSGYRIGGKSRKRRTRRKRS